MRRCRFQLASKPDFMVSRHNFGAWAVSRPSGLAERSEYAQSPRMANLLRLGSPFLWANRRKAEWFTPAGGIVDFKIMCIQSPKAGPVTVRVELWILDLPCVLKT